MKRIIPFTFCFLLPAFCSAADLTPPRVFFSDAKISVEIPDGWNLGHDFPYGALFTHRSSSGTMSTVLCAISAPIDTAHMSSDITATFLENFAHADLAQRAPHATLLAGADRTLAAHNAYDLTWEDATSTPTVSLESEYFFNENRIYALTLKTDADSFSALSPQFQSWLSSLRFLSRQAHGQLDTPAHGGLWVHQTGGVRILVPSDWLIGIADDRQLGTTYVSGTQHAEWTATVDPTAGNLPFSDRDKKESRDALEKEGFQVTSEGAEPLHDLPGYQYSYEGKRGGRFVKGQDLWVVSPQGRWLFNIEADGSLFNKMGDEFQDLWNGIQFLEKPK